MRSRQEGRSCAAREGKEGAFQAGHGRPAEEAPSDAAGTDATRHLVHESHVAQYALELAQVRPAVGDDAGDPGAVRGVRLAGAPLSFRRPDPSPAG